jgi:hypothetical protein
MFAASCWNVCETFGETVAGVVSLMVLNVVFGAICLNLRKNKSFIDIA